MAHPKDGSGTLRPPTEVLTRGFDPSLALGSASGFQQAIGNKLSSVQARISLTIRAS